MSPPKSLKYTFYHMFPSKSLKYTCSLEIYRKYKKCAKCEKKIEM
jgi:hypothetical protein